MRQRCARFLVAIATVTLVAGGPVAGQEVSPGPGVPEVARFVDNSPTDPGLSGVELLLAEDALLTRLADRIVIHVRMKTPEPGSYRYALGIPETTRAAPEVFTGWLFIFNRPEFCISNSEPPRCGPEDFTKKTRGGVYNVGSHVSSITHHGGPFILDEGTGGYVIISGEVLVGSDPLPKSPPEVPLRVGLEDPMGVEVHLAIVSHGQLDPSTLPGELYEPEGIPTCQCWWVAMWPGPVVD